MRVDRRQRPHSEVLSSHQDRSAQALDLERPAELVGEHRVQPARREQRERQEAGHSDEEKRRDDGDRRALSSASPQVDSHDRQQDRRPELRREPEAQQCATQDRPLSRGGGDRRDGEQRRPEVEAGVEEGAEDEWRHSDREQCGPRLLRAGFGSPQRPRRGGDASRAAQAHQHRERRRVAPRQVRRQEHRRQRGRRILEREVAIRDRTAAHEPRVVDVDGNIRQLALLEPADERVEGDPQ